MTTFDLADESVSRLNQALHMPESKGAQFNVINPGGKHCVAVGATQASEVTIDGHVGYYCAGMNKQAEITVSGNAGPGLAENMMSGVVRVKGNASQYCGATAHGGLLIVEGNAAARCGISMKGVDIIVQGSIGHMSAFMAQTGRLVVLGDTGESLGDSIYEARIYLRGKPNSLGTDCIEKTMADEHKTELGKLLEQANISGVDISAFKRYGSARELYNFKVDNLSAY